jgi:flagellar basal body-associated protein FliL
MKSDKIKLIVAIVIFAIAAVVIAWQLGVFEKGAATPTPPAANDPAAQPRGGPRAVPK